MQVLKQSTAATILVGPVLDSTGAAYTGAVIGDFNITKNGTTAAMAAAATATHDHNGCYLIALTTGNTDTLGRLAISCNKSTYAMAIFRYEVLQATVFDALVTNAAGAANGLLIAGSNAATTFATLTVSGAVAFQSTFAVTTSTSLGALSCTTLTASGAVALQSTLAVTGTTTLAALTTTGTVTMNALTVSGATTLTGAVSAANASNDIRGILLQATQTGVTIPTVTTLTNLPAITSNWLTAAGLATDAAAEIAAAVLTTQMTESYRSAGTAPTLAQAAFELIAGLLDHSISGTTKTIRNIAGTAAKTYTLDSSTAPTSITETT